MRSYSKKVHISEMARGLSGGGIAVWCYWHEQNCPNVPCLSLATPDHWNNICWLLCRQKSLPIHPVNKTEPGSGW